MADYNKATNFTAKDSLPTGNAGKIVKGTEIDTEFTAIASAISSKADINSPAFTGTPTSTTAGSGTNTTQIATTAFVTAATVAERTATSTYTNKTLTSPTINTPTITGGTITGITDLTVADGGTGSSSLSANAVLLGNGTSALQTVAPSTSGNVLKSNGTTWQSAQLKGLGLGGEVWNNELSNRVNGTTYTNSRAYPIMVAVSTGQTGSAFINFSVNGVLITQQATTAAASGVQTTVIVPVGQTYSASCNAIATWVELY
jgi:hypothetical protein